MPTSKNSHASSNSKNANELYLKSIGLYAKQFKNSWDQALKIKFPFEYSNISDVIISGMGGSAFGGMIVKAALADDKMLVPVEVVNRYDLPSYADEKTLVIVTSYSGNTEETLGIFKQAKERGCKIAVISSGGKLGNALLGDKLPGCIFETKFNPSGSPRTGFGYILGATLGILSSLKLLDFSFKEADQTVSFMDKFTDSVSGENKLIVKMAEKIMGYAPIFISGEHLVASAHIWRNFFNETAKNLSFENEIPEMNHHFLDGLMFPPELKSKLTFVFIKSQLYNERNQKRVDISRDVVKKNGYMDISITLSGVSKIMQAMELVIIGSLVSYHIALMHNVDPGTNEQVDYLKAQLGK